MLHQASCMTRIVGIASILLATSWQASCRKLPLINPAKSNTHSVHVAVGHGDFMCRTQTWIDNKCPWGQGQACTNGTPHFDCNQFIRQANRFFAGATSSRPKSGFYKSGGAVGQHTFLVYAGHSKPASWSLFSESQYFPLADGLFGQGENRYAWFFSCDLFAHGSGPPFSSPIIVSSASSDVFSRWTKKKVDGSRSFGSKLRLACGPSTLIDELPGAILPIFLYHEQQGRSLADSFILGLAGYQGAPAVTPLCITRSKFPEPRDTPLADRQIDTKANDATDNGYVFIEYPRRSAVAIDAPSPLVARFGEASIENIDRAPPTLVEVQLMPILTLSRSPLPDWFPVSPVDEYGYSRVTSEDFPEDLRRDFGNLNVLTLRRHRRSGAMILDFRPGPTAVSRDAAQDAVTLANLSLALGPQRELVSQEVQVLASSPRAITVLSVDRAEQLKVDAGTHFGSINSMERATTADRQLLVGYTAAPGTKRRFVPVEGIGSGEHLFYSRISGPKSESPSDENLTFAGDGNVSLVFSAPIPSVEKLGQIRTPNQALELAYVELRKKALPHYVHYELAANGQRWAYKTPPANCEQGRTYLYYIFDFIATDTTLSRPRVTIEIPAHLEADQPQPYWICDGPSVGQSSL